MSPNNLHYLAEGETAGRKAETTETGGQNKGVYVHSTKEGEAAEREAKTTETREQNEAVYSTKEGEGASEVNIYD